MDGFDENGEKTPHVDTSPPAADRHKDPNAPTAIEWQREKMLQYQGYCYFFQEGNIAEASIDVMLTELGQIPSTVPRTDAPIDDLQTNFGFVGYTAYWQEEQPQFIYIMDNSTFRVFYSPQREEKGYDMPHYLYCSDRQFVIGSKVLPLPLPAYAKDFTEIGVITAEVDVNEYPRENLTTNCGYVGGRVLISPSEWDGVIVLEDGYINFSIPYIAAPSIRYKGALFINNTNRATSVLSSRHQKVGCVLGVIPGHVRPTADFYCNFGAIGCEVYASKTESNTVYILYDGQYFAYSRIMPGS